jgi:outer membrane lipoprotein-sorting protein
MKRTTAWILGAALLATLAPLPCPGQTASAATSSKDALAVLEKMIEATGGRKTLVSIKDTTISAEAEIPQYGITVPVTIYQKEPDKIRMDMTIAEAGLTITQAFDGKQGWYTNPQSGMTEDMPDYMVKEMARQATGSLALLDPQKAGATYSLKPKAQIEGKDYVVLEQTLADGHMTTLFLDPETYLPYKTVTKSLDESMAEVDTETYSGDYRKVGNTMVAHSMRVLQRGAETRRITISSVTYNTNLDDAFFRLK